MLHSSRSPISIPISVVAFAMLSCFLGLIICVGSAYAYIEEPELDTATGIQRLVYNKYQNKEFNQFGILNPDSEADSDLNTTIKNLKSSNTKVLTVKIDNPQCIRIQLKKAGTAKVTYKYQGVKHTVKYIVKNYANPVKTFKFGKKNYASKFKKSDRCEDPIGEKRAKLSVVPAKNWKLKSIWTTTEDLEESKVKNNTKVTAEYITLKLVNKKTKIVQELYLNLYDYGD